MIVSCDVTMPLAVGVTEVGLSEHVGTSDTVGCTEQVSDTEPLKPFKELTVTVEVALCPGVTVEGFGAEPEIEKSGWAAKLAVTD